MHGTPSLARAPVGRPGPWLCGTQEAHDLRNLLATLALHLETLERLSGPNGAKAADAAHAIIERAAALCDVTLDSGAQPMRLRRQRVRCPRATSAIPPVTSAGLKNVNARLF
jgi:hypothetical protein